MEIRAAVAALFVALALQAAQWTVIGPGGGGTLFLPTVSPHDPDTVLTHCDMTGSYITHDGGASWRMFNLRGVANIFAFDPQDPKTIYAYSTGLFRSNDAGRTWKLVYPDPASVEKIIMPDDHAGERLVAAGGRGRMSAFAIHPADSKKLYAVIMEGRGGPSALQMSADYGKTWKKLADLSSGSRHLWVDKAGIVYASGRNSIGTYRDGVWNEGKPAPVDSFRDVSAGFANGKLVVWAIQGSALVVSEDSGATWRTAELRPGHVAGYRAIATSLNHPETAYVSYGIRGVGSGVAKTADLGKTWEFVWQDQNQTAAANMHDPWMYARFGPGWTGAPGELGVAPNHPNVAWGVTSGSAVKTTDGGRNWYGTYARAVTGGGVTTTGLDVTTNYGVHFDPFDRRRMFISYTDIGLFASEDGGRSWESASRTMPRPWVNTTYWMEFDPEVKGRAWAVASGVHDLPRPKMWRGRSPSTYNGGVVISDDGGRTWRVASESLPPTAATHIVIDPRSPKESRTLYVTGMGRGVFKSTDGGKTWALKNKGIAGKEPMVWRITRAGDGTLYLVVARRSDDGSIGNEGDGALYRSSDGAESWQPMRLPEGVNGPNGLAIDPADGKRLYLAAWGRQTEDGAVNGGVWVSPDAGASWTKSLTRDQHVYDVTADPRNKTLYACGFEDSAWRSRDRGATWERIRGYNFKWGHRVVPDPYNPKMIYITTFGGSVWYGPADGDPKAAEDIVAPPVVAFPKK